MDGPIKVERKTQTTSSKITRWLFPTCGNLQSWARIVFGLVANVVLLAYVLPRKEHLFDARDYRYVQIDMRWIFLTAAVPLVMLVVLLPALRSSRPIHRWLAIGLAGEKSAC